MIENYYVDIVGGAGGPNGDSIPVYGDNKAPNGDQVIGPNGSQLLLPNSAVDDTHYVIVNLSKLTPQENIGSRFVTYKLNGSPNYVRLWFLNEDTGQGQDYGIYPMWVEYSHLAPYTPDEPQPTEQEWTLVTYSDGRTPTIEPR